MREALPVQCHQRIDLGSSRKPDRCGATRDVDFGSAGSLTGTIADARLSANVALLNAGQTFSGANNFNASVTLNPPASLSFSSQTGR